MMRVRPRLANGLAKSHGAEHHGHGDRRDDVAGAPRDDAINAIGHHARVVHGRESEPDESAARFW